MHNGKWGGGMCTVAMIGKILLIVGGINWGLVGIGFFMGTDLNIVSMLLGSMPMIEAVVYILVGVAAVMSIIGCKCAKCSTCVSGTDTKPADAMM